MKTTFTRKQTLLLGGALLFAVVIVIGSNFGSRWVHGTNSEPLPDLRVSQDSSVEREDGNISNFPEVPDGFPMTPVWLEDYFQERDFSDHVTMYRVLIELWNQGDHDFLNAIFETRSGRVYPIYPDVIYVWWDSYTLQAANGKSVEMPFIRRRLGATTTVNQLVDSYDRLFTDQEITSGAFKTKFPGISIVNAETAGYEPAAILIDYQN